MCVSKKVNVVI